MDPEIDSEDRNVYKQNRLKGYSTHSSPVRHLWKSLAESY